MTKTSEGRVTQVPKFPRLFAEIKTGGTGSTCSTLSNPIKTARKYFCGPGRSQRERHYLWPEDY
jgi:hypothetical protein